MIYTLQNTFGIGVVEGKGERKRRILHSRAGRSGKARFASPILLSARRLTMIEARRKYCRRHIHQRKPHVSRQDGWSVRMQTLNMLEDERPAQDTKR